MKSFFPWKAILITFALSFVLGALFERCLLSRSMQHRWKDPEARQRWILERLDKGLDLSESQEQQVAGILKEAAPLMQAAHAKMRPEMEAVRQQVHEKIIPVLTAEQQQKYTVMEKEWQERKAKKFQKTA